MFRKRRLIALCLTLTFIYLGAPHIFAQAQTTTSTPCDKFDVMTRNMYVGADFSEIFAAQDVPTLLAEVAEAFSDVQASDVQARIAAMLLLTLRGTPTIYYGDEIGMRQVLISPDRVRDPFEKSVPGIGVGRDGARTPMQWDVSAFAGFSTVEPWLPVSADFRSENVENDLRDPSSIYNLYRRLITSRRRQAALSAGSYRRVLSQRDLLLYVRQFGAQFRLRRDGDDAPRRRSIWAGAGVLLRRP